MMTALMNDDAMTEPQLIMLDVDACEPSDWNPNVEDLATFNELVENIRQVGMVDPIQVVPLGDDKYRIVGGEHRWKASRLAGLERIPAVVLPDWDEDVQKVQTVKLNVIRGRFDPKRFAALWNELEAKYGRPALM